mmetsp:Transcript_1940/g.6941  ORF Transcript_1940/g.6941 Transcript_1940/m.6941 type:complete len:98 (+) Transcript_1940:1356-1649(+)
MQAMAGIGGGLSPGALLSTSAAAQMQMSGDIGRRMWAPSHNNNATYGPLLAAAACNDAASVRWAIEREGFLPNTQVPWASDAGADNPFRLKTNDLNP